MILKTTEMTVEGVGEVLRVEKEPSQNDHIQERITTVISHVRRQTGPSCQLPDPPQSPNRSTTAAQHQLKVTAPQDHTMQGSTEQSHHFAAVAEFGNAHGAGTYIYMFDTRTRTGTERPIFILTENT